MPATPNLALPYPVETDTADVPRDIKALADRLDLSGGYGSVLPAAPVEGQRYAYVADAAGGVVWQLRYHVASGKWECLGGPPLYKDAAASVTCDTLAAFTDFSDGQPTIVLPVAGDYIVDFGAQLTHSAAGQGIQITPVAALGMGAAGTNAVNLGEPAAGGGVMASVSRRLRPVQALSGSVRLQYFVGAAGGSAARRYLSVTPIRVG